MRVKGHGPMSEAERVVLEALQTAQEGNQFAEGVEEWGLSLLARGVEAALLANPKACAELAVKSGAFKKSQPPDAKWHHAEWHLTVPSKEKAT